MFSRLVDGTVPCIEGLINEAYSEGLIASSTQSGLTNSSFNLYTKANKFWSAIQSRVTTDDTGETFERLLKTLKTLPAIAHLQKKLERLAQYGPDREEVTDQPERAFSGPHPGGSFSGQHPIANVSGSSTATAPPDESIVDSSNLSVDSGVWQEPDSTLSLANHDLSSTSQPDFMPIDSVQHTHSQASEQPALTLEPAENSAVEETGKGTQNHTLVTSGGQQLAVPQPQSCSATTLTLDEALRSVRLNANLKDAELSQTKEELQKSRAENNSLQQQLEKLTKEKDREAQEKDKEINELRAKMQEREQKIVKLETRIARLDTQIAVLQTQIASFEKENEELKEKNKETSKSMVAQQTAASKKMIALEADYLSKMDCLRRDLKDAEDKKKDAVVELSKLETQLAKEKLAYEQKLSEMKAIVADKNMKEAQLEVQLAQERQKNAEIRAEMESDKREKAEIRAEMESDKREKAEIRAEDESAKRRCSEARAMDLEKQLASLRERLNETDTS